MSLAVALSEIDDVARQAESWTPQEILDWALERFHPRIAFASSFGVEDVAVIHMLSQLRKDARVFTLDTGRLPAVEIDHGHGGIVKVNPLVKWTEAQTWDYVRAHKVPYNALHDQGYPSLGCAPCTRAIKPGEDVRAGRWWWESPETKECGLHKA